MKDDFNRRWSWREHIQLNAFWFGLNLSSGIGTPVLLPYMIAMFVPSESKNSALATIRVASLAVAMLAQPVAGILSDRNRSRWGRRRPFILIGTLLNLFFLAIVGISPLFMDQGSSTANPAWGFNLSYLVLMAGVILLQASTNMAQGAYQALIPDRVPPDQRGRSSGVKAVLELLPAIVIIFIGPLVDAGYIWWTLAIIGAVMVSTMLVVVTTTHEVPYTQKVHTPIKGRVIRAIALVALFVGITQASAVVIRWAGDRLSSDGIGLGLRVIGLGGMGLLGMAGSIVVGVYFGTRMAIGRAASRRRVSFIWWVVNRLLFLAAIGSVQGFAQYYLADVIGVERPAAMTTLMLAFVVVFLLPAALGGGILADRYSHKKLLTYAGLAAAAGTSILLFANSMTVVIVGACIIGAGTGLFFSTNWALGTSLAPAKEAGRYLGISNLAGAGAGIVGTGLGGPMADFFNRLQPGLGYHVIFVLYLILFLLSVAALARIQEPKRRSSPD
ncbi:MAG: MFS transporter [Anaerolineales bacterium]|jgi:MFS family permease